MVVRNPNFDPAPAFLANGIGNALQLLRYEVFEQRFVEDEHALFAVAEKVALDRAAGLLISLERDEANAAVRSRDLVLQETVADNRWITLLPLGKARPDTFLGRMVVRDCECHDMLECHFAPAESFDEERADTGKPEALLHDGFGDTEARRDVRNRHTAVRKAAERFIFVRRMHRLAHDILGKSDLGGIGL